MFYVIIIIGVFVALFFIAWAMVISAENKVEETHAADAAENKVVENIIDGAVPLIHQIIISHARALATKQKQLVSIDEYGVKNYDRWLVELDYFKQKVILTDPEFIALLESAPNYKVINSIIEVLFYSDVSVYVNMMQLEIDRYNEQHIELIELFSGNMSPEKFETACADALVKSGWAARRVGQTGDQGADVIATKNINGQEIKAILQCKLYSSPVGNDAVQEVFSAKQHYYADIAAVVTNQSYTKSAKELSNTTGVILLHHDDMAEFDGLIGIEEIKNPPKRVMVADALD